MKSYVQKLLIAVLEAMKKDGKIPEMPVFDLSMPASEFGDLSTNVAFQLARITKENPMEVAEKIGEAILLADKGANLAEVKVVKGFLNIYLHPGKIAREICAMQKNILVPQTGTGKKVVFEYSSPNTNKPLHIGHTRNDVYGAACINLLKAVGYKVVACEIINDRGIHIMKSMLMYMKFGDKKTPETESIKPDHFVGKFYAMFSAEVKKNPGLEKEAQGLLQKWEAGDKEVRALWQKMNGWFYAGVKVTYEKEGSHFDEVDYESQIYDKGRELVEQGVKQGVFVREPDGAVSVDLTADKLDKKILLRADGTTIYITQDLYLWYSRAKKHKPDMLIVTTSSEQAYHFAVLKKMFELMKFEWADSFQHLPYEHVYLGKEKMSSRAGNTVSADDLLETIKGRVREVMKNSQKIKASVDDDQLIEDIAFAAIKYGYLKYDRNTKIYFDMEETIAVEGNTGPYLQYTHARIYSVLRKALNFDEGVAPTSLDHPTEKELIHWLMHYPEIISTSAADFKPSILCAYLHDLASRFNVFYDQVSVLQAESDEKKLHRLNLLAAVANVLEHGLGLLGIKALKEM